MRSRLGRPKLMFEAPQVVLTPSSSRSRRTIRKTCWPAVGIAPIGMTSGSTMTSSRGMPWSAARSTICLATANRTSGSSEMPVSSFEIATTAAPYLLTSGSTRSRRSSSPVTRVHERLALVDGEPGLERLDDRGVDRQRDVDERLDELDGPGEDRRLVGERDARVDVEHVGAGLDLGDRVALDAAEVAGLHLLGEQLAAGRVDALADDRERPVEADDDLAGRRARRRSWVTPRPVADRATGGDQARARRALRVRGLEALGLGRRLGLEVVAAGPLSRRHCSM